MFFVISKNYPAILGLSRNKLSRLFWKKYGNIGQAYFFPPLLPQPHSPLGRPCICWFIFALSWLTPLIICNSFFIHFFRWFMWTLTACFFFRCVSPRGWWLLLLFLALYYSVNVFFSLIHFLKNEIIGFWPYPAETRSKLVSVSKVPKSFPM